MEKKTEAQKLAEEFYTVRPGFRSLTSELATVVSHVLGNLGDLARALRGHEAGEAVLAGPAAERPLVILVHGTGAAPWQWVVARSYLREAGIHSKCVTYASEQPLQASAVDVVNQVRQLMRENQRIHANSCKRVPTVLIGHSQGGIIARLVLNRVPHINRVFLLHAPQQGATAASAWNRTLRLLGLGSMVKRSMKDMAPDSEFVAWYKTVCAADDPRVYEAAGDRDYVRPDEALTVKDEGRKYVGNYGHYSAVVSKLLWDEFIIPNILSLNN